MVSPIPSFSSLPLTFHLMTSAAMDAPASTHDLSRACTRVICRFYYSFCINCLEFFHQEGLLLINFEMQFAQERQGRSLILSLY